MRLKQGYQNKKDQKKIKFFLNVFQIKKNVYLHSQINITLSEKQGVKPRKKNEQKKFDYIAPIIILEGMKFFEKHLLKAI